MAVVPILQVVRPLELEYADRSTEARREPAFERLAAGLQPVRNFPVVFGYQLC